MSNVIDFWEWRFKKSHNVKTAYTEQKSNAAFIFNGQAYYINNNPTSRNAYGLYVDKRCKINTDDITYDL